MAAFTLPIHTNYHLTYLQEAPKPIPATRATSFTKAFTTNELVVNKTCISGKVTTGAGVAMEKLPVSNARTACKQAGDSKEKMNFVTDSQTYAFILQECASRKDLIQGKRVHAHITNDGFEPDIFIGNNLISMYVKCGSLMDARQVFDKMPKRNVVTWNALMAGYCSSGQYGEIMDLFSEMQEKGVEPNKATFVSVFKACRSRAEAEQMHALVMKAGFLSDVTSTSILVDGYVKCDDLFHARQVFDEMPERDVVSWTSMITGYAQNEQGEKALELFCQMLNEKGVKPNRFTFSSVLTACAAIAALEQGKAVHASTFKSGVSSHAFVGSALITMYMKCGRIEAACKLFERMPEQDMVSWSAMVAGYVLNGYSEQALSFCFLNWRGLRLENFAFSSILTACGDQTALETGRIFHAISIKYGVNFDAYIGSALITLYMKCGCVKDACKLFERMPQHHMVTWSAMLAGYMQNGYSEECLSFFRRMQGIDFRCNEFIFASVLTACANSITLEEGKQMHANAIKAGFESAICVANALLTLYGKGKNIDDALKVFTKIKEPDGISCTTMVSAYVLNGEGESALELFCEMLGAKIMLDESTFAIALRACASLAVGIRQGMQVHGSSIKNGFESTLSVRSALVTMYAKCGIIEEAQKVFDQTSVQDLVMWNAMIAGYAQHGYGKRALDLFEQMKQIGIKPNHITFVGVLTACSHVGLVDEGYSYFNSMRSCYEITPMMEHYNCMVDIISRSGHLDEAIEFINKMPFDADATVWRTLLGACRCHGNLKLGKVAAEHILELEPEDSAAYVLLSNIYSAAGRWQDRDKVRELMDFRKVKKKTGYSSIEIKNQVHTFIASDQSHPQTTEIYFKLHQLNDEMKDVGFIPNTNFVLHDLNEKEKEQLLLYHSEKLAIAYGLISTPPGTCIYIFKNLRVCGDCHSAMKFISKIAEREIVVRDTSRFHHFKDGLCSCDDYW